LGILSGEFGTGESWSWVPRFFVWRESMAERELSHYQVGLVSGVTVDVWATEHIVGGREQGELFFSIDLNSVPVARFPPGMWAGFINLTELQRHSTEPFELKKK
jgi:hypothetical protein